MKILLANDDGIMSPGIHLLAKYLQEEGHELTIIAPENQRSALSHAITLHKPIIIKEVSLDGIKGRAYSISGTPADCVRVGMEFLTDGDIDIVFSGINMGLNSGMDILYSGTVSAAIEANIYGIPSIAVSSEWNKGDVNYEIAAKYAVKLLNTISLEKLDTPMVLNLNTPFDLNNPEEPIKVCRIGGPIYDYYIAESNGNGDKTLKVTGRKNTVLEEDTDRYFLSKGYATLTPLGYDFTNFELMDRIRECIEQGVGCE
ncbi:MAG: 5'/3'-nucleotidase SurE [Gudongella sp.]|jgi:5'-nucleotidase|nr:5'/3'-nucleotidase SurE [Gudongella sp.]